MGILDNVTKASEAGEEYIKALLWGPNGTGKSTLCGTAPEPILYAYTERQGLLALKRMAPDAGVVKIESLDDLRSLLTELRNGEHDYKSICLDSFTEMQLLIADEILARRRRKNADKGKDEQADPSKLVMEDYMFIHDRSKAIVRAFRDLPMHVILTCLSESVIVGEDSDAKTVTRIMLMGRKLPAQLGAFFNLVGFSYKAQGADGATRYRVLFEGRPDIDTKGMPGLRRREEPDISYWYDRAVKNCDPRDSDAPMIAEVSRTWSEPKDEKPKDKAPSKSKSNGKKKGKTT